jgi:pyridoxamine 5'-phosphate oxidase
MPEARVAEYWRQKTHESRLLDLYYTERQPQSSPVASRETLLDGIGALGQQYPSPEQVPRPAALSGVYLVPHRIEVWRGAPNRLHDRRLFERAEEGWRETVLVP